MQATMVGSLVVIPWTIKPLYGFFTDNFPVLCHSPATRNLSSHGLAPDRGHAASALYCHHLHGGVRMLVRDGLRCQLGHGVRTSGARSHNLRFSLTHLHC